MKVKDVMTRGVEAVQPDTSIRDVAERMRSHDVGAIPVCEGTHPVGMITDRDITVRTVAQGYDPRATTVRQAMTEDLACCAEDDDVAEAAELMSQWQIRRLPVVDKEERLVGIVSVADLARAPIDPKMTGETVRRISQPISGDPVRAAGAGHKS